MIRLFFSLAPMMVSGKDLYQLDPIFSPRRKIYRLLLRQKKYKEKGIWHGKIQKIKKSR